MSYPKVTYPAGFAAGYEYSPAPSQGGSLITVAESALTAPNDPVELADPVVVAGGLTGVCVTPPAAAGADCVIQTTGIFSLPVVASDDGGTANVVVGAKLYIDDSTGVISLDATSGNTPFGIALAALSGSASASNIPVKLLTV